MQSPRRSDCLQVLEIYCSKPVLAGLFQKFQVSNVTISILYYPLSANGKRATAAMHFSKMNLQCPAIRALTSGAISALPNFSWCINLYTSSVARWTLRT